MNIVGKTLVILNLVFALLVGGFLLFDFAARTNWKAQNDDLRRELEVARAHNKAGGSSFNEVANAKNKLKNDIDTERVNHLETKAKLESELAEANNKVIEAEVRNAVADKALKAAEEAKNRMQTEVFNTLTSLKKAEERVSGLEVELRRVTTLALQLKNESETTQTRNESLLAQNRELQRRIADVLNPTKLEGVAVSKGPLGANPPPVRVQGQILKVDAQDKTLMTLSLGTDNGVQKNHTLEVYRFQPKAEYLGMVRILESYHKQSIGKLVNPLGLKQLQVGDTVSDTIVP